MAYQVPSQKIGAAVGASPIVARPSLNQSGQSRSWGKGLAALIIAIVIIGGGVYLLGGFKSFSPLAGSDLSLQTKWQAIFLTNGQVYFGKISRADQRVVILSDIYYLQVVTQPLQRSQDGTTQTDQQAQQEQRLTLIKLGNEIHGPRDEMTINWDQIVLVEDLKDSSRVVQAINDYINQKNQPNTNQAAPGTQVGQ